MTVVEGFFGVFGVISLGRVVLIFC